jgi:hypothetical protein
MVDDVFMRQNEIVVSRLRYALYVQLHSVYDHTHFSLKSGREKLS